MSRGWNELLSVEEREDGRTEATYRLVVDGRGSPFASAEYRMRVIEGETYNNRSTSRTFRVLSIDEDGTSETKVVSNPGGNWPSSWNPRTLSVNALGLITAAGNTPPAMIERREPPWDREDEAGEGPEVAADGGPNEGVPPEHFRCDGCGKILDNPPTPPTKCECGGTFYRYVRAGDSA